MNEVVIVGAGLCGLSAAYFLKKKGIDALVLEARQRWGGRIETVLAAGKATPVEMGATWFADKHVNLMGLLQELKLPYYKQFQKGNGVFETGTSEKPQLFQVPDMEESSYRITGGTSKLIETLVGRVGRDQILLGSPVTKVSELKDHIEIENIRGEKFSCKHLVITIPPFLIVSQRILFDPVLAGELVSVLEKTHTWMDEAIKFAVEYDTPFWRRKGYSGTIFSHSGIAMEVYDHSNFEGTHFALKGFLSTDAINLKKEEREYRIIEQLTRLLGEEATNYLSNTEKVWKGEPYTYADYEQFILPHQNNGHPLYSQSYMSFTLLWRIHGRCRV
jgi:monoamine oxidase